MDDAIPGDVAPESGPETSAFVQSVITAINAKPEAGTVRTEAAPNEQKPPAKTPDKANPAETKPEAAKPPKIDIRKLIAGEEPGDEPVEEAKPTEEAKPAGEDVPKAIKSTKAAEEFKKLKAERDSLKAQLEAAKATPAKDDSLSAAMQALQKERDELSQRLREVDIERHPEFQTKFGKRIEGIENSIKAVAGPEGEKLVRLIGLPDSEYKQAQIDAIVDGLGPAQRAKLGGYLAAHETALAERKAEVESAKGSWEQRQAAMRAEEEQAKVRDVAEVEQTWNAALLSAAELEPFQVDPGDPESAKYVATLADEAKSIYMGLNSNQALARAALAAAAVNPLREAVYAQVELNKRLAAEVKRLKGASPQVTRQQAGATPKKVGFVETVMAAAGR